MSRLSAYPLIYGRKEGVIIYSEQDYFMEVGDFFSLSFFVVHRKNKLYRYFFAFSLK